MHRRLALTIATWFYSGYSPVAPGTAGSILAWAMAWFAVHRCGVPAWAFSLAALAIAPLAVTTSDAVESELGGAGSVDGGH